MVKRFLLLGFSMVAFVLGQSVHAQYYYLSDKYMGSDAVVEIGGSVGAMNAFTDIGGKSGVGKGFIKDLTLKTTKPSFGVYGMVTYKEVLGIRLEGTFGTVQAYDSVLKSDAGKGFGRYERNLNFRSKITDFQLAAEFHPLFLRRYETDEAPYFSPYVLAGIGYYSFNPQGKLGDTWYNLQPLRTEGQGFPENRANQPYKLQQFNVPVGIGLRYEIGPLLNARFEIVHRFLLTDYLDDVSTSYVDQSEFYANMPANQAAIAAQLSNRTLGGPSPAGEQRGNPKNNDSFFTMQLKVGFLLRSKNSGRP